MEKSRCLASVALFRELYSNQKDIYGVLSQFLKDIIIVNKKHQFNLTEITKLLNRTYDFKIPDAVVKTALKRLDFLERSHGVYSLTDAQLLEKSHLFSEKHKEIKERNESIIDSLFDFIENHRKQKLQDDEKERIVNAFCNYLLSDETLQEYSEYISGFIIQNKRDVDFTKKLNTIKEGVILYSGLRYSSNINDLGSWNTDLIIYLDTEILFSLAGYNGELYKVLFDDFYEYVNEINTCSLKKVNKKRIKLKYFREIKEEVEGFFKKAESIVEGKEKLNPSKAAMCTIVNGCVSISDVIEKKVILYQLLESKGISLDDNKDYYENKNHKFNIEDISTVNKLGEKVNIEDAANCLELLNYINILRKNNNSNDFEDIGFMLLTANRTLLQIAWDETIKQSKDVPLATDLGFLTDKFWFKLNKGFGNNHNPKTFDVITKAQIILSSLINKSVSNSYEELQNRFKTNMITEAEARAIIIELRKQAKKPEEISVDDITDVLSVISENSIEQFIQEQTHFKNKAQEHAIENEILKGEITKQKEVGAMVENELRKKLEQKSRETEGIKAELDQFKKKEEKKKKRYRFIRYTAIFALFIFISIILFLNYNKSLGVIFGIASGAATLLQFFGIDYKKLKELRQIKGRTNYPL